MEHHVEVLFTSTTKLVQLLQGVRKEYRLPNELIKLDKYDVIIFNDIGYVHKDKRETQSGIAFLLLIL